MTSVGLRRLSRAVSWSHSFVRTHMITNLLQRAHEVHGEQMLYRFGNGLVVKTEHLGTKTPLRILGLGSP